LTTEVDNLLKEIKEGNKNKRYFDSKSDRFYEICYDYIYNWSELNHHNSELKNVMGDSFQKKLSLGVMQIIQYYY